MELWVLGVTDKFDIAAVSWLTMLRLKSKENYLKGQQEIWAIEDKIAVNVWRTLKGNHDQFRFELARCQVREGSSHRKSTAAVKVNRLQIAHESRYNFVDLTPKMKLMWWDKILLIMTWGKTEEKPKALSVCETIYKYTLFRRRSLKLESKSTIY